jgi:hypothetical protein
MSNVRRQEPMQHSIRRLSALVLLGAASLTATAQTGERLLRDARVSYALPSGWVVEDFPDHRGVFTYALIGGVDVEASIGIELAERNGPASAREVLDSFVAETEQEKQNTAKTRIGHVIGKSNSGLVFGRVDYRKFRAGGDLLDSVYVIPIRANRRVYIYTSVFEDLQGKYKEIIESVLNSVSVAP